MTWLCVSLLYDHERQVYVPRFPDGTTSPGNANRDPDRALRAGDRLLLQGRGQVVSAYAGMPEEAFEEYQGELEYA